MGIFEIHGAAESSVMVYPKTDHQPAVFTVLNFPVEDIESTVNHLMAAGVTMEHYDLPDGPKTGSEGHRPRRQRSRASRGSPTRQATSFRCSRTTASAQIGGDLRELFLRSPPVRCPDDQGHPTRARRCDRSSGCVAACGRSSVSSEPTGASPSTGSVGHGRPVARSSPTVRLPPRHRTTGDVTLVATEFDVPAGSHPHDVAPAADGGVWYTAQGSGDARLARSGDRRDRRDPARRRLGAARRDRRAGRRAPGSPTAA